MSNNKFKYPIFPDRLYTLTYEDGYSFQVKGQAILDAFKRQAQIAEKIKEWLLSSDQTEPDTSYFVYTPDENM